ncbi:cell adhesion molecule Dscam1-like isoform X3 [Tachypleus tridentatus]|uniref:cell adhesion molecule Dscam1-like isoform X3 n=1 Tax=Tachypleus tridentatus TaxID=6853 RepID=UPI003FD5A914
MVWKSQISFGNSLVSRNDREDARGLVFIQEPPTSVNFMNTDGTSVPCSVKGRSLPIIRWIYQDGSDVRDIPGLRHIRTDGTLVFTPFKQEEFRQDVHSSVYRCLVSNSVGKILSREVHVHGVVKQNYKVEVRDEYVLKGNPAVFKCHVPSYVKDFVLVDQWVEEPAKVINMKPFSEGQYTVLTTGELYVRDIDQSDTFRSYRCRTKHKLTGERVTSETAGKIIVTEPHGQDPLRITHFVPRIKSQEGDIIQLSCAAQSRSKPTYTWNKLDGSVLHGLHRRGDISIRDGILTITHAQMLHSGKYVCFVNNTFSEDKRTTELVVTATLRASIFPSFQEVDIEASATLTCDTSGYPIKTLLWLKDAEPIQADSRVRILQNNQLLISSVARRDAGMYQCFIYNEGESAQGLAQVVIADNPPVFLEKFETHTVIPGQQTSLKCVASGSPLPQVTWNLDGLPVPENLGFRLGDYVTRHNTVVSYLNISETRVQHGGNYECQASNAAGLVRHSGRLTIPGPPFIRPMKNLTVVAGEKLVLTCPIGGYPISAITWERDGVRLPDHRRQTVFSNGTLVIEALTRPGDEGLYTCRASNKEGNTAEGNVAIFIRIKPQIEPFHFPQSVHINQRLSISCTVIKGDPPIKMKWLKNGHLLTESEELKVHVLADYSSTILFKSVNPDHRGQYTCTATNHVGTDKHSSTIIIHVPPRWRTEPSDTRIVKGGSSTINCRAEGFPPPRVAWLKAAGDSPGNYQPVPSTSRLHVVENGSLVVLDARKEDGGYYLCQASNGIGSDLSKVIYLSVHVAAHFHDSFQALQKMKGEEATLRCDAYGERPIKVSWLKDKQPITSLRDPRYDFLETVTSDGVTGQLIIRNTDRRDSALFTCRASNMYGQDESNIQLLVQEPPDTPQDVRVQDFTSRTVSLSWSPSYSGNSRITKYIVRYQLATDSKSDLADPSTNNIGITPTEITIPASETKATITSLSPVTTFSFRVIAVNNLGHSDPSGAVVVTTKEEAPGGPPRGVTIQALSSSQVKVTWKPPKKNQWHGMIKGYYVGYKITDSSGQFVYKTLETGDDFKGECVLTGLRRFTRYTVKIQAFNSVGTGPSSDHVIVKTLKEDPPMAIELSVARVTYTTIDVVWRRDPIESNIIGGYQFYIKAENENWQETTVHGDLQDYTFINLQCGTRYEIYAVPYNDAGRGQASQIVTARTNGRAPIAPQKQRLLKINTTSVVMDLHAWDSVGCAIVSIDIKYKGLHEKNWLEHMGHVSPDIQEVTIPGLLPSSSYQLLITARNPAGSTQAEYTFRTLVRTGDSQIRTLQVDENRVPFYLEIEIILPVVLSAVVVLAVLILVCLIMRKRQSSESSYGGSSTYGSRKVQQQPSQQETVQLSDLEKLSSKRQSERLEAAYYPCPYATTRLSHEDDPGQESIQDEPQYATVKRTPRPPKPESHIYHYPVRPCKEYTGEAHHRDPLVVKIETSESNGTERRG